jgi:hypothetical protein
VTGVQTCALPILGSVVTGMIVAIWQTRSDVVTTEGGNDG